MRDYNINSLFYSELLQGFTKLKNDFDLDDITVSKVFLNLLSVSSETFIRSFQLKLLDDIVFTNKRLAKIGYVLHDTCTFCKVETETIYHLFYECPFTLLFWENFENFWFVLSGKREKFTLQDVYIGKLEKCNSMVIPLVDKFIQRSLYGWQINIMEGKYILFIG